MKTADYIIAEKYADLIFDKIKNKQPCDYEELRILEVAIAGLVLNHQLPGPNVMRLHREVESLYSCIDCENTLKGFTKGAVWGALTFWKAYQNAKRKE